jgi:hypothetical protein
MSAAASDFKYMEAPLAERLGIPLGELKFLRQQHLEPDSHWKKTRAGVALNATGPLEKVLLRYNHAVNDLLDCRNPDSRRFPRYRRYPRLCS